MDEAGAIPLDASSAPKALVAITDGNDSDLNDGASPTNSSSSSKRLNVAMESDNNEISAASREEDRWTQ